MTGGTQLKALVYERHWQTYRTFCAEYDRAAQSIDPILVGSYPSRAQFHRWLAGTITRTPYPDACRVLEKMFPGWPAADLFQPVGTSPVGNAPIGAVSAGEVVERRLTAEIDVAEDGAAVVVYEHVIDNASPAPLTRFVRELWFKVASGPIGMEPLDIGDRDFIIRRVHETPAHLTYACQLLPALQSGDEARLRYRCTGGVFADEHYWRQAIVGPVDELQLRVRLHGVTRLSSFSATEEKADGSEVSAADTLSFRREDGDVILELTRPGLVANQFVTLAWDFPRATA